MNNNEPVEESLSIYLTEMGIGHKERELILKRFDAKDARIKELEEAIKKILYELSHESIMLHTDLGQVLFEIQGRLQSLLSHTNG